MYRYDKSLILAKIESPYGTDATPAAATEAIITRGIPTFDIINNPKTRDVPLPHFGKVAPINQGEALKLTFTTELKGSGTAGTAGRLDPLFRACNFTAATSGGVSVIYTPNSTMEGESATIYFHADGTLHKVMGCVGTFVIKLVSQEISVIEWTFTGMYASTHPSTVTFPTATHEAIAPVIWKAAGFTINTVTVPVHELSLDIGNNISKRLDANATTGISRYFVSQRDSKGSALIESQVLATQNLYSFFSLSSSVALAAVSGSTAGNICTIAVTGGLLDPPKYSDKENVQMHDLSFSINPTVSTGNNAMVLTFT